MFKWYGTEPTETRKKKIKRVLFYWVSTDVAPNIGESWEYKELEDFIESPHIWGQSRAEISFGAQLIIGQGVNIHLI